jgi:orotate phosphoribosyltransferase
VREVLAVVRAAGARPIGVAAIVNRSGADNPFEADGLPFWSLAVVEALSWTSAECPLCKSGEHGPAVKPGSRPGAAAGKG